MPDKNASSVRNLVFDSLLKSANDLSNVENARSRRQAREYINGITRQKRWLNHIIDSSYSGSRDLDDEVRVVLQIGLYDLLFLSTPSYAAINDAVNLARNVSGSKVTGLVNAILRRVQREGASEPTSENDIVDLATRHSHPDWMVDRWMKQFGREGTIALMEYNNRRPRHCLRVNRMKADRQAILAELRSLEVEADPAEYSEDFVYCNALQEVLASQLFRNGFLTVQDESAGLVVEVADPKPGQTIVDLCSSPGGKTGYMLERVSGDCRMIAVDKTQDRLDLVHKSVERLGFSNVEYVCIDASQTAQTSRLPSAHLVLIDAPCSGLGVLSKRPDMRWRRTERQIRDLVKLQDALLDSATAILGPGGKIVYSTCTIEPVENQERVTSFLSRNQDFEVDPITFSPGQTRIANEGALQTLPHIHAVDGAFAVRLRKKGHVG